jgi:hypothetical protein
MDTDTAVRIISVALNTEEFSQPFLKFVNRLTGDVHFEIRWRVGSLANDYPMLSVHNESGVEVARFNVSSSNPMQLHTYRPNNTYAYLFAPNDPTPPPTTPCASQVTRVLEFEIDASNQRISAKFEGQLLYETISGTGSGNLNIASSTFFTGLDIHGSQTCASKLHDIYLIDSGGDYANTWLGHDFKVVPTLFNSIDPAVLNEWTEVSNNTDIRRGNLLNINDGDSAYVAAGVPQNKQAYKIQPYGSTTIGDSGTDPNVAGIRAANIARKKDSANFSYTYIAHDTDSGVTNEMGAAMLANNQQYTLEKTQFINEDPRTDSQWELNDILNFRGFGLKLKTILGGSSSSSSSAPSSSSSSSSN